MSLYPELDDLPLEQLAQKFRQPPPADHVGYERSWYAEVAYRIATTAADGIQFLLGEIDSADEDHLCSVLVGLSWADSQKPEVRQAVAAYLSDSRELVSADAIESANHLGYTDFLDQVLSRKDDPSPYVAGSVLRYLSRHYPEISKPLLMQALESSDPIIIQNGIDELSKLGDEAAMPRIKALRDHPDPDVREAVEFAVSFAEMWKASHDE